MTQQPYGYGGPGQPNPTPTEHTSVITQSPWETAAPGGPPHLPPTPPAAPPTRPGRSRAGTAGVLVAALLVGGAGGLGGAAIYDASSPDTPAVTSSSSDTSSTGSQSSGTSRLATGSTTDPAAPEGSPEAVAAKVLPSVVKIDVLAASGTGGGSGSGVILSADGEILTNNHVVEVAAGGGKMTVSLNDGTTAPATVVGTDPVTDLAVIKAEGVSGLTPAQLGDSAKLDVGEGVVAIGSPFGLDATVTSGIVSALNRPVSVSGETGNTDTTYPAIQTDAAINPGNSGGPLVNLAGQVIGIDSSIRTASSSETSQGGSIGLGFAIPISNVLPVVEQLRQGETPTHARLGVTVENAVADNGVVTGARIRTIDPGSAADEAGLRAGDVVTRVDDHAIAGSESLVATIRGYRPGDKVELTVQRGGNTETIAATLNSDKDQQDS